MVPFAVKNTTLTSIFSNTVKKTFIYVYVDIMNFNDNRSKLVQLNTLFFFYKNIFYKNIEAEMCEILRIF